MIPKAVFVDETLESYTHVANIPVDISVLFPPETSTEVVDTPTQSQEIQALRMSTRNHANPSSYAALLVYIDDIVYTRASIDEITSVKVRISHQFKLKDLGILKNFLGLEIARSETSIFISQGQYAFQLLEDSRLLGAKPRKFQMDRTIWLSNEEGKFLFDPYLYQRLVGHLIYVTITRLDITFPIQKLSQFMSSLVEILGDQLLKQFVVARSSTKVEYRPTASTTCELVWLQHLLHDLSVLHGTPALLFCDSTLAIQLVSNPTFNERTKHIQLDCHFICEKIIDNTVKLFPFRTHHQLADMFTKLLPQYKLSPLMSKMALKHIFAGSAEGGSLLEKGYYQQSKQSEIRFTIGFLTKRASLET
ncbi:hypothetical protein OSB04_001580 [Centaurea solstitialis]|uniref:Reverse transcriptase Ty1/copia-type domain-containing protein n=1 Tax=Centaurea solstitialis TaxID=347529 RepID=A0AA38TT28_9ASTR|nr:hypothetical protein OSB04_001580 [Centaurea solstitialis]